MSDYKKFVKSCFEKYRGQMDAKDIIKLAAKDWKKVGKSKTKGGKLDSDSSDSSSDDDTSGGNFWTGGSLKMKKTKAKRVSRKAKDVHGGNWFDDAVDGISTGFNAVVGTAAKALPFLPLLA